MYNERFSHNYLFYYKVGQPSFCLFCPQVSENTKYTSSHIIDEMVEVIGQILDDQLVAELSKSPVWGLMVDETTDISVTKQLGLAVR